MENENESIKSLLRTTLEWARLLKVKFRFNAETLSNHELEDFVREWGYDIDGLIDDLQEFDVDWEENITFENGDFISWELWNSEEECAVNYSISFIDYEKVNDEWVESLIKFQRGLL